MSERLFKVLGDNRTAFHGGKGVWKARAWMPPIADIEPCARGYHLCREQDLLSWLGPNIYEAEYRGERVDQGDKIVVSEARLVRRLATWNDRTARLFAADCAEQVVHLIPESYRGPFVNAIAVARRFAVGKATDKERAAAWDAARDAARAAARDAAWAAARAAAWAAARDAARAAARDAARAAAWAAAWDAAWDAAWAAARDAAWAAARADQTSLLVGYLYPEAK